MYQKINKIHQFMSKPGTPTLGMSFCISCPNKNVEKRTNNIKHKKNNTKKSQHLKTNIQNTYEKNKEDQRKIKYNEPTSQNKIQRN